MSGQFYVNLAASINVINDGNRKVQFYTVINNLTNKFPPYPDTQLSGFYDRIGRYYRLGVRFSY